MVKSMRKIDKWHLIKSNPCSQFHLRWLMKIQKYFHWIYQWTVVDSPNKGRNTHFPTFMVYCWISFRYNTYRTHTGNMHTHSHRIVMSETHTTLPVDWDEKHIFFFENMSMLHYTQNTLTTHEHKIHVNEMKKKRNKHT